MIQFSCRTFILKLKYVHWTGFLLLWGLLSMVMVWFYQEHFTTRHAVEELLGEQFSPVYIDLYLARIRDMTYGALLILPLIILVRITLMALLVHLLFLLRQHMISFKKVFQGLTPAFGILLLKDLSKLIPLCVKDAGPGITQEVLNIPLSLSSIFSFSSYPVLSRLLNAVNLFEVLWVIAVGAILSVWNGMDMKRSLWPLIIARWCSIVLLWGMGVFYEIYML